MTTPVKTYGPKNTAWCSGCGNFSIAAAVDAALREMKVERHHVLIAGGIGQAAKTPQYLEANGLCALHGRALPTATGIKIANADLTVIVHSGDGDSYAEGGNHLIHAIRRNIDLTLVIHNNQVYGLTRGQASPTSDLGFVTTTQPHGVGSEPLNGPALALSLGCGFVARSFSGDPQHLTEVLVRAATHRGFSLVEVLQPCISFNKVNTFSWYKQRIRNVDAAPGYDPTDRIAALAKVLSGGDEIPIGVFYESTRSPSFHEQDPTLRNSGPLVRRRPRGADLLTALCQELM